MARKISDSTDDQKPISFKVSSKLYRSLVAIKDKLAGEGSKERSMSDVIREVIENSPEIRDGRLSFVSDPAATLQRIQQDISSKRTLNYHQWLFLADMGHQAYMYSRRKVVDRVLLIDNLKALRDVVAAYIKLAKPAADDWLHQERYFLGNLGQGSAPSLAKGVEMLIGKIEENGSGPGGAEFYTRCLVGFLSQEGQRISDELLAKALNPYLQSLFVVAVKGYWYRNDNKPLPLPEPSDAYLEQLNLPVPPRALYDKAVQLSVIDRSEDLSWLLLVNDHRLALSGLYPDLQDLMAVMLDGAAEGDMYALLKSSPMIPEERYDLYWKDSRVRLFIQIPTYKAIVALLRRVRSDPKMVEYFDLYAQRYGRI